MDDVEKRNQWLRFSKDLPDLVNSKGKSGEYVLSFFTFSLRTPPISKIKSRASLASSHESQQ